MSDGDLRDLEPYSPAWSSESMLVGRRAESAS